MRPSNVLRIGAISLFLAGWFRELTVVHGQFWPVLVGYAWISMSYPIMLSGCVFVANKWYNDKERAFLVVRDQKKLLGLEVNIIFINNLQ